MCSIHEALYNAEPVGVTHRVLFQLHAAYWARLLNSVGVPIAMVSGDDATIEDELQANPNVLHFEKDFVVCGHRIIATASIEPVVTGICH